MRTKAFQDSIQDSIDSPEREDRLIPEDRQESCDERKGN